MILGEVVVIRIPIAICSLCMVKYASYEVYMFSLSVLNAPIGFLSRFICSLSLCS